MENHFIESVEALEDNYEAPGWIAFASEIDHVSAHYRTLIDASPFVTLCTSGPKGIDVSVRGGEPGFVKVGDEKTLLLADSKGNNRLDTLHNLVHDPRIGLMFLIPGCDETLRVKGAARISTEPDLLSRLVMGKEIPRSALVVDVESVHFQCAKAVRRAKLWSGEHRVAPGSLPGPNAILAGVQWNGLKNVFRSRKENSA